MRKRGTGDHAPDGADVIVLPVADCGMSQANPGTVSALLHGAGKRAIVDDSIAYGGESADFLQHARLDQDAAPGRCRNVAGRRV